MKPNAKVSLRVNEVSMHVHNANFDVVPFPHSDAGPYAIVRGWGHDSIFNVVLYTLEDAASLLKAVFDVVDFFAGLETEESKRDGDADGPVAPADDEGAEQ